MGTQRGTGRRFDREHAVTTQALLFLGELEPKARSDAYAHATHYEPVPIAEFAELVERVPSEELRRSTFVDVGCGMGRAILLAMQYPFKQVVGIELSGSLYEVATANLAAVRNLPSSCRDVRLLRGDARKARFPRGKLVVFLFNPFDGDALDAVLDRLDARGDPGGEWILYHTPEYADRLLVRGYTEVSRVSQNAAVFLRINVEQDPDRGEAGEDG
jgi:SAM-dependent methyltransferase